MPILLALAQTIVLPPGYADRVVIDVTIPTPCAGDDEKGIGDEIVVCARMEGDSPYRLARAAKRGPEPVPRAEILLSDGTTVSAETESADLGMARSQRLMVRWKVRF